jgi:cobalt-zinc-cadmium efflux system outer membrane protein
MRIGKDVVLAVLLTASVCEGAPPLTVDQVVDLTIGANPRVRSAQARWTSADHAILPAFAPADPTFTFFNADSPANGFSRPASQSFQVSQPLGFPGKGYLQGRSAGRSADIARLAYEAIRRDVRAEAQTAFYQLLLDQSLGDVVFDDLATLKRVLEVTQVGYSTGRVTQLDFISAEFELASMEQQRRELEVARATDRANLNRLLDRSPEEPLEIQGTLDVTPLNARVEQLIEAAGRCRQEILQAALTLENNEDALTLAKLEYAPDFTLGYVFNHYEYPSAAPNNHDLHTYGVSVGINLPLFFWVKQREDVERARADLAAARADMGAISAETATQVSTLFWQAELSYRTALLYRDTLVPLARQGFEVALVAYQGGKVDFVALNNALRRRNQARVAYLQSANQYLAQRIALEEATGKPGFP